MFREESIWIKRALQRIPCPESVLDIGSSTPEFRTIIQPYIDANVFRPLREKGVEIRYLELTDSKRGDFVADISSRDFSLKPDYDLVLCTNLLEHVKDLETAVANISSVVREKGYLLVTAPCVFPYHPDPIDNLHRFTPQNLLDLFGGYKRITSELVFMNFYDSLKVDAYSIMENFLGGNISYFCYDLKESVFRRKSVSCVLLSR
jgi:SAM-dependent methyltransferase